MKKALLFFLFLAAALILGPIAGTLDWNQSKVSPALQTRLHSEKVLDVMVTLTSRPSLSAATQIQDRVERLQFVRQRLLENAEQSQKNLVLWLRKHNISHQAFYIENVIRIPRASKELIQQLAEDSEVASIGLNAKFKMDLPETKGLSEGERGLSTPRHIAHIKVDKVWELGIKGEGIVIAGQDTGYMWDHESIKNQYRGFKLFGTSHDYNWHDAIDNPSSNKCPARSSEPCDDKGHGTHTMGTILGFDGKDRRIGVAPEAKWIGCRNMDLGVGTVASYLECFEFFMAPYPRGGDPRVDGRSDMAPHIISNSWSCPTTEGCTGGEFLDAIRALQSAGIMMVVAAGNAGPNCGSVNRPPAAYGSELISVGAYNNYRNEIAFFSSRGPSAWDGGVGPTLVAPGEGIVSAVTDSKSSYYDKSGTSMATPQVAGVIALLWSKKPELIGQIEKTREILIRSATPIQSSITCGSFSGAQSPNAIYGHGMLNALAAIESL